MRYLSCALLFLAANLVWSQQKLTVDAIFNNELGLKRVPNRYTWRPGGESYLRFEKGKGWLEVEVASGDEQNYLSLDKIANAFVKLSGFSSKDAKVLASKRNPLWNGKQDTILYNTKNDLFVYNLKHDKVQRLTHDAEGEVGEDFSPDNRMVSFIRDFNIHLIDLDTMHVRQVTGDGTKSLLYGRLDWVYQEELYGRGNFRGYWWSPDGAYFAFLQIDESEVPTYTVVDHLPYHPDLEVAHYPKAGDPNPRVRIGVVPTSGGAIRWMDTFAYEGGQFLVVRLAWHPDSTFFTAQIQDREQTWLDLISFDPNKGTATPLLRETSKTWVGVTGNPMWTPDGNQFVWRSERDGWSHFYLYDRYGKQVRRLTHGEWEATGPQGYSSDGKYLYFSENKDNILDTYFSRVNLDTARMTRLSKDPGTHRVALSDGARNYFDASTTVDHAGKLELRDGEGKLVRELDNAGNQALAPYGLTKPEFLQVNTRDGFVMEAMLIKPPGFDPKNKYPVMSYTYSGPHAPRVRNRWGGERYLWHHMLARDLNCLIWICDNRTASGKGKVSTDPVYRNMGELELRDLEDGVAWLIKQGYADPKRVGIWGWSYGGYMTAYAMTHSKVFSVGISGAPVIDWRDYDSIYTERYMAMPQNNEEGYRKSSPIHVAKDLYGSMLIIHGTIDDNVHLQNTIQMINALQNAGKQFEMMLYPRSRHGIVNPAQKLHLYHMMTDFLRRKL